jgi:hypothetical protein
VLLHSLQWVATLIDGLKIEAVYDLLLSRGSSAIRQGNWKFVKELEVAMLSFISLMLKEPTIYECKTIGSFLKNLN